MTNKSNKGPKNRRPRGGSSGATSTKASRKQAPTSRSNKAAGKLKKASGSLKASGSPKSLGLRATSASKTRDKAKSPSQTADTPPRSPGASRSSPGRPRRLVSANRQVPNASQKRDAPTAHTPPKRKLTPAPPTAPPADWAPNMDNEWDDDPSVTESDQRTFADDEAPASSERTGGSPDDHTDSGDFGMLGIGTRVLPPDMEFELFDEEPLATDETLAEPENVEERIRELEARLDGLMTTMAVSSESSRGDEQSLARTPPATEEITSEANAVEAARELLQSDYYRRKWGRASLRAQVEEVDDFGLDPDFEQRVQPLLKFLFRRYFRVETRGIDNVPAQGRAVIVANHSGTLPLDGVMLREALREHHPVARDLRWLAEDFIFYLPFIGVTMNRIGAVRACQENAQRLLAKDHLIAVFPEGTKGIKKLYRQRYQLQRFGRGGYIRLCLRTRSPLIPCAIVGAEETNPMLYRLDNFSRVFGLQYLPITPTFPWLGPFGLVPAPTKWRVTFGEPIALDEYGPEAADDHVLIGRLSERVRASISSMLQTSLRARRSVWL